jgi:hypothetical protein
MITDPISTDQDCVALFRRAMLQRDQQAREAVQQCFTETVRGWLHRHPKREIVCGPGSEEQYVAQVFACPQEWSSEQEVSRLRHLILERLLHNMDQVHW